ncbi:MAG TPA: TonB family protein [Verrucomicrobiae bacterium]|nr:TonB family protein [Verrucomicrobiae bacterium]
MSAIEKRFRRNFILACIIHGALVVGIVVFEGWLSNARSNIPTPVTLITPADILGDLPKGPGVGRGNYAPPPAAPESSAETGGPNPATLASDEQQATPKPKVVSEPTKDPNEVAVPRKRTTREPKPMANTIAKKTSVKPTSAVKSTVAAKALTKASSTSRAESADAIRRRFASALTAAEDGTPGGDNRSPGGGTGESRYGRLGSPNGAEDGIAGGIGKGSPFWSYYLQVHDRMYEAWEQPGEAVRFDKKLVATIVLRVARDGRIDGVRLEHSSGNKLMDDSALAAARSVPRLEPLPEGLGGDSADISVNFRLEG